MAAVVFPTGDAAVGANFDDFVLGLEINEFHTYRFESRDGLNYQFSVDGEVFVGRSGFGPPASHRLQFGGFGACLHADPMIDTWDYIRYGSITDGEAIVSSDPPAGSLDVTTYAGLDRFTVTFDGPNFVLIDQIDVTVNIGPAPVVTKVWRLEGHGMDTFQVVLDRPLTERATTRFTFTTAAEGANVIAYTLGDPVPTMSGWGLVSVALLLLIAGTLVATRRSIVVPAVVVRC